MPRFNTVDDHALQIAIEQWKQIAAEEVEQIGGWRDSLERHYRAWIEPKGFFSTTSYLSGAIAASYPKIDPSPLTDVYLAVSAWYRDRNAHRIPPQRVLFDMLERAILALNSVEHAIEQRAKGPAQPTEFAERNAYKKTISTKTPREQRDEWMNAEAERGTRWEEILDKLRMKHKRWPQLKNESGVRLAVKRYRIRHNYLPLKPRHTGKKAVKTGAVSRG